MLHAACEHPCCRWQTPAQLITPLVTGSFSLKGGLVLGTSMLSSSGRVLCTLAAFQHASPPGMASLCLCNSLVSSQHIGCLAGTVPTKFASALVETPEMEEANKNRTFLKRLGTPQVRQAPHLRLQVYYLQATPEVGIVFSNRHGNQQSTVLAV